MRRINGWTWASIILAGLVVCAVIFVIVEQAITIDRNRTLLDESSAKYDELLVQYTDLYDEAVRGGVEPDAPDPSDVESTPGPAGTPGTQGPPGPRGPQGEPGTDGSPGERGVDGTPGGTGPAGTPGQPGADGTSGNDGATGNPGQQGAQGDPGPSGAPGPVGALGPAGPAGADGPAGPTGPPGADGRGVLELTCLDDGAWLITYTDTTTSTTPGPCRVPDPITPEESS